MVNLHKSLKLITPTDHKITVVAIFLTQISNLIRIEPNEVVHFVDGSDIEIWEKIPIHIPEQKIKKRHYNIDPILCDVCVVDIFKELECLCSKKLDI